jgi:hypothetical protein
MKTCLSCHLISFIINLFKSHFDDLKNKTKVNIKTMKPTEISKKFNFNLNTDLRYIKLIRIIKLKNK